jgi:hypothetical protein
MRRSGAGGGANPVRYQDAKRDILGTPTMETALF